MIDPATGQRSFVQALKVPFDLKGVALGALAFLALVLGARAIAGDAGPWFFLDYRSGWWERPLRDWRVDTGDLVALFALQLAVAAFLGVACCRIAGMRLARDEGVDAGAALTFATRNLAATAGAFLFMAGAMGLFYAFNAAAGFLCGLPALGPLAAWALFPLVLISSLVLFLLLFGSVLGFPLVLASLAVERNGALDAVSRAFSYVFSRPVLFFAYGITVYLVAGLLALCTLAMEGLAGWSFTHWFPDTESHREVAEAVRAAGSAVVRVEMPEFGGVAGMAVVAGWAAWLLGTLFHLSLMGWVVYYVFGGGTAAYFALRRDVDGTEDEEIWVEGEDARFGEPEKPVPPGGTAEAARPPEKPSP